MNRFWNSMQQAPNWLVASFGILIVVGAMACGAVVANDDDAEPVGDSPEVAEESSTRERGFLDRVFEREPVRLTAPAGTVIAIEFEDTLSSHETPAGTPFVAEVVDPVIVDGATVIPAGAAVLGRVTEARKPKGVGGRAKLSLDFHTLELADGQSAPISAVFAARGKSEAGKDAAIIGGSTLGGAILGEAIDGGGNGDGDVIGGIVGAIGGTIGAVKTKGKPVLVPAGTVMSIELGRSVTFEVD